MKDIRGKMVGILGTVIVHLIAAIIFMSFQIHSLKIDRSKEFTVEFEAVEEAEADEQLIQLPASAIERILQGDEEMLNIARNLANRPDIQIDPADYIDKVKEELIESGKLGTDNYIDEQKRLMEMSGDEPLAFENSNEDKTEEEIPESNKMAADYQGPTRIYYELEGRHHLYLPIPIYKCQGSGKIVLLIKVNRKGKVEEAKIVKEVSTTSDPCLIETALSTARISRFNPDINAPELQSGSLTYHFVAQ